MKVKKSWNYNPYHPVDMPSAKPEILAVRPTKNRIYFEWRYNDCSECEVFYREKGQCEFFVSSVKGDAFFVAEEGKEYEFYIKAEGEKSVTRIACSGEFPGIVVNYLHPEDNAYAFSGKFLASPSIVRLPSGDILASMDIFSGGHPQNLTKIFKSSDDGNSWKYVTDLYPCFWGTLFVHEKKVYNIAVSKEYGDLILGCSEDEGVTWGEPVILGRGSCFEKAGGFHKAPVPVLDCKDKLAVAVEYGCWSGAFSPIIYSVDKKLDIMNAENWHTTGCALLYKDKYFNDTGSYAIEGNLVEMPDGTIKDYLRYGENKAVIIRIDDFDSAPVFEKILDFPFAHTKFHIQKDGGTYYACGNIAPFRNVLSLAKSVDGEHWKVYKDVLDYSAMSPEETGFQYPSFFIENGYAYILSRTGLNKAENFHNSNAITFHKIKI